MLSDTAEFLNKTTDNEAPAHGRCILWNDATLQIDWPKGAPNLFYQRLTG
ncbi:dTDP-4-dehydrorhamnose 3,5-epimerase family protein [Immundisolibacter sp.]|nr:dTDP-4-dehydrorhamnose 3,5-epimerase family protein [Immundisolibacter sp.]